MRPVYTIQRQLLVSIFLPFLRTGSSLPLHATHHALQPTASTNSLSTNDVISGIPASPPVQVGIFASSSDDGRDVVWSGVVGRLATRQVRHVERRQIAPGSGCKPLCDRCRDTLSLRYSALCLVECESSAGLGRAFGKHYSVCELFVLRFDSRTNQ